MKNPWKISTLVLAVVLGFVISTPSLRSQAQADAQPRMQSALEHLEAAKAKLEDATKDKGGYRKKAIKFTDKAIIQVKAGIAHDNAN